MDSEAGAEMRSNRDPTPELIDPEPEKAALREELAQTLCTIIAPYTMEKNGEKPPFTVSELVTIATVCVKKPTTKRAVVEWILTTFPYYTVQAAMRYTKSICAPYDYNLQDGSVLDDLGPAFQRFETPLYEPRCLKQPPDNTVRSVVWEYNAPNDPIFTPLDSARIFLGRWLDPPENRAGAFAFLRLPEELRAAIYELVLSSPASGIRMKSTKEGTRFFVRERELDNLPAHWHKVDYGPPDIGARNKSLLLARDIFSLLLVSKQIYNEAVPVFYQQNKFCLDDPMQLHLLVRGPGKRRLEHLRDLYISLEWMDHMDSLMGFHDSIRLLDSGISRLWRLRITGSNKPEALISIFHLKKSHLWHWWNDVERIHGFCYLASLASRADLLILDHWLSKAEAWLRGEVDRLRSEAGSNGNTQ